LRVALFANFPYSLESSEIAVLSKWISIWEMKKSLPEPGQVSRVADKAQLCSCWPKSHESIGCMSWHNVMMEEPGVVSPKRRSFSPEIFS
jgi:hypothetical protein